MTARLLGSAKEVGAARWNALANPDGTAQPHPFISYEFFAALEQSGSASAVVNEAPLVWLFVAGALLVAGTLIYYATITPGGVPGASYTPPRMGKDGRIEPGQLR